MVDFNLTEEQEALRKLAHEFAAKEIAPLSATWDKKQDPKECFPSATMSKAFEIGFQSVYIPVEFGGLGKGDFESALITEELAKADAGFANALLITASVALPMVHFGTRAQKEKWLVRICKEKDFMLSLGVTEQGPGSEAYVPSTNPSVGLKTTFTKDVNNGYIINGTKHFITNGACAKLCGVAARNANFSRPSFESISVFFVESGTPGLRVGKIEDKMGQRATLNSELIFDNVRVSKDNLIGYEEKGGEVLGDLACSTSINVSALCVGLASAAEESAARYSKQRFSGGKPIFEHESIALILADMRTEIEAAKSLLWKVAWMSDNVKRDYALSAMTKVYSSEMCKRVTNSAMQIYGGYGYMRDLPIEKYVRDAQVTTIYDGTSQVLKQIISGAIRF